MPNFFEIVFVAGKQTVDHFHFAVRLIQKHPDQRRADKAGPSRNNVPFHILVFATATNDSPGHGSSPSTRRQNHTVLSNNLSAGRLMALRPSTFRRPPGKCADFIQLIHLLDLKPVCPSIWPSSSRENLRSWPMP